MLLPNLLTLHHPTPTDPSPEDIFSTTLGSIFTDDMANMHGEPHATILYRSRALGRNLEFRTADVNGEEQRTKFAHYLWNAGVLVGEIVGGRGGVETEEEEDLGEGIRGWWIREEEEKWWSVAGQKVLELGAGVGLAGIMSVLAGAEEVTITDYPSPPLLETLTKNLRQNVPSSLLSRAAIQGHTWGDLSTPFATSHAHKYTRILAADCYWMPHEHENLARSMTHFLSADQDARVLCVAGFHTGRGNLVAFFGDVVGRAGLEVESIYEMDAEGRRREWMVERREGDGVGERKRWMVVARLKRT